MRFISPLIKWLVRGDEQLGLAPHVVTGSAAAGDASRSVSYRFGDDTFESALKLLRRCLSANYCDFRRTFSKAICNVLSELSQTGDQLLSCRFRQLIMSTVLADEQVDVVVVDDTNPRREPMFERGSIL